MNNGFRDQNLKLPDMISDLPDQLLLEILSCLPTRQVVATMLLSKRWKFLWKQMSKLDYDYNQHYSDDFSEFVSRSMQLLEDHVLRIVKLSVSPYCEPRDVENLIDFAVSRFVSELEIDLTTDKYPMITTLPKSLYTCRTLTCLKLKALVLDDIPEEYPVCLSSLHYLYISVSMQVSVQKFIGKLSDGAPLLEKLVMQGLHDNTFLNFKKSFNLLKSFTFCSSKWDPLRTDSPYFGNLEHFCIYTCSTGWWDSLIRFLHSSPKLRYLRLIKSCNTVRPWFSWNQPITTNTAPIPECLSSTLQTLEWRDYTNTQLNKDVVFVLLKNATCLTKAKIFPVSTTGPIEKLRILTYLSKLPRGSTTCQLIFGN